MPEELIDNQISELHLGPEFREMIEANIFCGRKKNKTHPRMKSYIFRTYSNMEVIDLDETKESLEKALNFLKEKVRSGASVFLVGTQPAASETILRMSEEFNFPAVVNRWLGGTLTNFRVISGRIDYYQKLRQQAESGELEKYTKKERLQISKEIEHLKEFFGTMENYRALPGVIVMIDPVVHKTAVLEARRLKIPIIALANTDANPDLIDYPVVGNNKSRKGVNWFLEKVSQAIREAKNAPVEAPSSTVVPESPSPVPEAEENTK